MEGKASEVDVVKLAKEKGNKTIAIIYSDAAFPRAAAEGVKERAKKYGLNIVLYEAYPKTLTDWIPIVSKAKDRKAEVLAGGGYLPDSIGIVKAAKSINYIPKIISLVVGVALPDFKDSLEDDVLNITGDADWEPGVEYPGAKEYAEAYKSRHGREAEYHSAGAYGGAQILEEAIADTAVKQNITARVHMAVPRSWKRPLSGLGTSRTGRRSET
jgi:branched-chain amino acid transport system substrate-binding protein